jgi:hypothetical protein
MRSRQRQQRPGWLQLSAMRGRVGGNGSSPARQEVDGDGSGAQRSVAAPERT